VFLDGGRYAHTPSSWGIARDFARHRRGRNEIRSRLTFVSSQIVALEPAAPTAAQAVVGIEIWAVAATLSPADAVISREILPARNNTARGAVSMA
jgi:hypothetical protein